MNKIQFKYISNSSFIESSSLFTKEVSQNINNYHNNQQNILQDLKNDRLFRLSNKNSSKKRANEQDQQANNWISQIQLLQDDILKRQIIQNNPSINYKNIMKKKQFLVLNLNQNNFQNKILLQNQISKSLNNTKRQSYIEQIKHGLLIKKPSLRQQLSKSKIKINLPKIYLNNKFNSSLLKKKYNFNQYKQKCFIQNMQNTKLQKDSKSKLNQLKLPLKSLYKQQIYEHEFSKMYFNKNYSFQSLNKSLHNLKNSKLCFFDFPKCLTYNVTIIPDKIVSNMLKNQNNHFKTSHQNKRKELKQQLYKNLQNDKQNISQCQKQKQESRIPDAFLNIISYTFSQSLSNIR